LERNFDKMKVSHSDQIVNSHKETILAVS